MFVIDWSQIGEGCRLDVRWIYNRGLNPDQLPLLLHPLSFLLPFSVQMRTIQVKKKGTKFKSYTSISVQTVPTGCLPSVSSTGGRGVDDSGLSAHRFKLWAAREREISLCEPCRRPALVSVGPGRWARLLVVQCCRRCGGGS